MEHSPKLVAPPFLTRLFVLNDDAADRYQVTIWYKLNEFIFMMANWITLIALFKFVADKTGSVFAWIVYGILGLSFLAMISSAMTYFLFTPIRPSSDARKLINFLIHALAAFIVFLALMIAVNGLVSSIEQIKS